MTDRKRLLTIFLIVFVDLLGFGLILPLVPFIADEFGASATAIGVIIAAYPAMQMIGAPILGRMSDRFGRRPILLISILGSGIGYVMLAFATNAWWLLASRVLDGLTGGNISVAQAYIADITDEKDRARGLGLVGAAFGLGFIFGPAVGGFLSTYGFAAPALAAAALTAINLVLVYFWLPESLTAEAKARLASDSNQRSFSFKTLRDSFDRPRVRPLFTIRLGAGLAFNTFQTIFPLYALTRFELNAQQTAFILTYVGVLIVIVQGGIVGPLTRRFPESYLTIVAMLSTMVGLIVWALTPNIPVLLLVMIPLAFGAGIFNTTINSSLSKAVYPEEVGGTLGLSASIESFTRVVSPIISGFLLGEVNTAAPGLVGGFILILLIPYSWRRLITHPDPPLPPRGEPQSAASMEVEAI
ncbi:MAG: MFS transporter [Anaerolineales bacterium]|nr:MFS transporter [Anaerolineales bacterium]